MVESMDSIEQDQTELFTTAVNAIGGGARRMGSSRRDMQGLGENRIMTSMTLRHTDT